MPTAAHALGQAGEAAAADFYRRAGYEVLAQGYRHGRAEVDLIVRQGTALPHASRALKSAKNRAVSTMQVSALVTSTDPEPMIAPAAARLS